MGLTFKAISTTCRDTRRGRMRDTQGEWQREADRKEKGQSGDDVQKVKCARM